MKKEQYQKVESNLQEICDRFKTNFNAAGWLRVQTLLRVAIERNEVYESRPLEQWIEMCKVFTWGWILEKFSSYILDEYCQRNPNHPFYKHQAALCWANMIAGHITAGVIQVKYPGDLYNGTEPDDSNLPTREVILFKHIVEQDRAYPYPVYNTCDRVMQATLNNIQLAKYISNGWKQVEPEWFDVAKQAKDADVWTTKEGTIIVDYNRFVRDNGWEEL